MEYRNVSMYLYISANSATHPWLPHKNSIRNVSVATDEGPSPKLALSEGGSRENIES